MEIKAKHPGEWILILEDGSYVHAQKLEDAYARVSDVSKIKTTLRPYKAQELILLISQERTTMGQGSQF